MKRLSFSKTMTLTTLALAASLSLAYAEGPGRGPSADRALERLSYKLELSADQEKEAGKILEESFKKGESLREEHRQKMDAIRMETRTQLKTVLTEEQLEEFDQLMQDRDERRDSMRDRRPMGRSMGGMEGGHYGRSRHARCDDDDRGYDRRGRDRGDCDDCRSRDRDFDRPRCGERRGCGCD